MKPGNHPTAHDMPQDAGPAARVVVGIGTASGGLELLQQFLHALPEPCDPRQPEFSFKCRPSAGLRSADELR